MKIENYRASKKNFYNLGITGEELLSELDSDVSRMDLRCDSNVMSCINVLSGYIASMSLQLFKENKKDSKRVKNDLTDILERPNALQNYFDFMKEALQEMLINKEVFIKIYTSRGQVSALKIINDSKLSEINGVYFVSGFIENKPININYNNCLHFRDSFDRFKALENVISVKKAANKLINKLYDSNLQTAIKGIINVEGEELSEKAKINLKRAFNKVLSSGDDNIGVLEEGMKFETIQGNGVQAYSFAESQVKEILAIQDDKIHQIFNVPKVLTSISEGSYNLSEAQKSLFIESLLPLIKMIEAELTFKLLTTTEKANMYFRINYESILRGSYSERANFYKVMKESGFMTIEEVRNKENLPYIEGTDDLMASLNYVPLSQWKEYVTRRDGGSEEIEKGTEGNKEEITE